MKKAWYGAQVYLFINEDVWLRNGITGHTLSTLSALTNNTARKDGIKSKIAYSTRKTDGTFLDESNFFKPRENRDAKYMLCEAIGRI